MRNFRAPELLRSERGFTLLETMIAMGIMIVAFSSILAVQSGSINASRRAKEMNIVAMLARNQMIETELRLQGKKFDEMEKEKSGTFKEPFQAFRWKSEIKEIEFPKLSFGAGGGAEKEGDSGKGGASPNEMIDMMTKLLTKFLSKSIREVTVTITWTKGDHDQNFSVATYWVDLNHEFETSE